MVQNAKIPDIAIGMNGTGSVTVSFILFSCNNTVAGPDENSDENPTDGMYVLLQYVSVRRVLNTWWCGAKSQDFVGRVAAS